MKKNDNGESELIQAKKFANIASTVFAPIYPVIAGQIIEKTGIREGVTLDLGSGPGHLAIALAQCSNLKIYSLDKSIHVNQIAKELIAKSGLSDRVIPVIGDVHDLKWDDNSVDLIVSRGSWFFWDDLTRAFREINRVLRKGGVTYIGGGFGDANLKKKIFEEMNRRDSDFGSNAKNRSATRTPDLVIPLLHEAGISDFQFIDDESGFWLIVTG